LTPCAHFPALGTNSRGNSPAQLNMPEVYKGLRLTDFDKIKAVYIID
jgi:hypothetical protein